MTLEHTGYEELLARDGQVVLHVVGHSMEPLLHDRQSIVVVTDIHQVTPRRSDVVLYKKNGTFILHRVLTAKQNSYIIRGDNGIECDYMMQKDVLGVMTGFYRAPESRLITRDSFDYRLYCAFLTPIRLACRMWSKLKSVFDLG